MRSTICCTVLVFAAVVLLLGATSADADTILKYQVSGPDTFSANFRLVQNSAPSGGNGTEFYYSFVPVDLNGTLSHLTISFFSTLSGGGVMGSSAFDLYGSQLFSWADTSPTPTMAVGTFDTMGVAGGGERLPYTVTVTEQPAAAVPEPASVVVLGMGVLALFGLRLRRRSA